MLISGVLKPGEALSRRGLAGQLGMSALPVAEALQRLEAEELVESRSRVGTRVRTARQEEMLGYYEVREALEVHCARLAAKRAGMPAPEEFRLQAKSVDESYASSPDPDDPSFNPKEHRFQAHQQHLSLHLALARETGCRELVEALRRAFLLTREWLSDVIQDGPGHPPRYHQDLVEAIFSGDPDTAERAVRGHVGLGRREVEERLRTVLAGVTEQVRDGHQVWKRNASRTVLKSG